MSETPGGAIKGRPLHFIWMCDVSGSMAGEKIQSLNFAIREALPAMAAEAARRPNAEILMRAIVFSDGAQWHVSQPTPIVNFRWTDVTAGGCTDMGMALKMVAEQFEDSRMPTRGLPPVIVLLTDGQPTDSFSEGLKALMTQDWGRKAVRIGIAIGDDADKDTLRRFIGNPELAVLEAHNAAHLANLIRWATTVVVGAVVNPPSQAASHPSLHSSGNVSTSVSAMNIVLQSAPADMVGDHDF